MPAEADTRVICPAWPGLLTQISSSARPFQTVEAQTQWLQVRE